MKIIVDKKVNGLPNPDFSKNLESVVERTVFTKDNSDELYTVLSNALDMYGGVGISANQLGIKKRACLIRIYDYELYLLNPYINGRSEDSFIFYEGCLSIPKTMKEPIRTIRSNWITVVTDNYGEMRFEINPEQDKDQVSLDTMRTVIVQHEVDHLDGITIQKRIYNPQYIKKVNYGRNDKVIMKAPNGDIVEVKYKKANDYFLNGYEII